MSPPLWLETHRKNPVIAVIRAGDITQGWKMAEAVAAAGWQVIEVTWNSQQPEALMRCIRQELPHCCLGSGTLLTPQDLRRALDCGAEFCFTPHVSPLLIQTALAAGIPMIPGALSPTEIITAWQLGATCVKVFPVAAMGGVNYIKALQAPLGQIPLIPTGGVTLTNAVDFIRAGAIAVGLSSQLFPPVWLAAEDWPAITHQARQLREILP